MKNLRSAQTILKQALAKLQHIDDGEIDAKILFEKVFNISMTQYYTRPEQILEEKQCSDFFELVQRRAEGVPVQHLTNSQEFMGLDFYVNADVLIPRQDTECLVEFAIQLMKTKQCASVLDVCTGSGCIIISLCDFLDIDKAKAVDISDKALQVAKKNADKFDKNIEFIRSDLLDRVEGRFDVIISNPPYIPTADIEGLDIKVKCYDPFIALDGHKDGLYFYGEITRTAGEHLNENGYLMYEIGSDQGNAVKSIMESNGFVDVIVAKDYTGLDRIVCGKKGGQ